MNLSRSRIIVFDSYFVSSYHFTEQRNKKSEALNHHENSELYCALIWGEFHFVHDKTPSAQQEEN